MDVIEVLKYMAKFPPKAAVLKQFKENTLNTDTYQTVKEYITALENPVLPEVESFIYAQNEDKIKQIVTETNGYLMMVEYGPITGTVGTLGAASANFHLSVIIAHHYKSRAYDTLTEAILMDNCLTMMRTFLNQVITDKKESECPFVEYLSDNYNVVPLAEEKGQFGLYESIGYVLSLNRTNNVFVN